MDRKTCDVVYETFEVPEAEDRIKEAIIGFIELNSKNLLFKEVLIDGVQEIDFTDIDGWNLLSDLLATYSTTQLTNFRTFEEIERLKMDPWKSCSIRKLWKAINSYDFTEFDLVSQAMILEILLNSTDENVCAESIIVEEL